MSTQMQNDDFILSTISEGIDLAASDIAREFALKKLEENGVVTIQECNTMYLLAKQIITEGSEDLIPDNIELPDEEIEADDLDVADLEGIVLPTADGSLMVVEGGVLVPYTEDEDEDPVDPVDPAAMQESDENLGSVETQSLQESEVGSEAGAVCNSDNTDSETQTIQESSTSDVVLSMINELKFKGAL